MLSNSDNRSGGMNRRRFLVTAGLTGASLGGGAFASHKLLARRQPLAQVAVYKAKDYSESFEKIIREGLRSYPEVVRRARAGIVVLKPNLVEYHDSRRVNTHPAVVAGAIAAFKAVGAKHVIVAEGPGHERDTELLLEESGLAEAVATEKSEFVDLNLDSIRPVQLAANYTGLDEISFPETILGASLVVSMAKLKTHHWAGVTLSLKNMFGTVPGANYGWPKNVLHWHGITQSIVDINLALRPGFAIIDGIEGMEGDGPLFGETVNAGVLIMGDNLSAVDATATRIMSLYPERIPYLRTMLAHGGTINESRIEQRGETVAAVRRSFRVLEDFSDLKTPPPPIDYVRGI